MYLNYNLKIVTTPAFIAPITLLNNCVQGESLGNRIPEYSMIMTSLTCLELKKKVKKKDKLKIPNEKIIYIHLLTEITNRTEKQSKIKLTVA